MEPEKRTCEHCGGLGICRQRRSYFGRQSCNECLEAAGHSPIWPSLVKCAACGGSGSYKVGKSEEKGKPSSPGDDRTAASSVSANVASTSACPSCQAEGAYRRQEYNDPVSPWLTVYSCESCGYVRGSYHRINGVVSTIRQEVRRRALESEGAIDGRNDPAEGDPFIPGNGAHPAGPSETSRELARHSVKGVLSILASLLA